MIAARQVVHDVGEAIAVDGHGVACVQLEGGAFALEVTLAGCLIGLPDRAVERFVVALDLAGALSRLLAAGVELACVLDPSCVSPATLPAAAPVIPFPLGGVLV